MYMAAANKPEAASLLPFADFLQVVEHAPLISIDLVVQNPAGEALLGWRNNQPACDHWFVPGGRVQKNETLDAAFLRLTQAELGVALARSSAQWLGVYEHFYDSNAGLVEGFGTHYVVLAYTLQLDESDMALPLGEQHSRYRWASRAEIVQDASVHLHSRAYFE
ncbi:colanic acid biosynthesis protein WcaH [Iodobacter fluviatilis]|uniref:Colanic acid biosynthesis protein WcaH n=2 Tax=Iodobacter fluviatilis TaxID=537 RepID=A0A377SU36_9NEIS|nr:colanic acid biosynthesis protein WcaH [Iodobacter fluviatilis]STR45541.1 GDP-mannose mannosyl hydrolase [Iodobacter fluviatilis]